MKNKIIIFSILIAIITIISVIYNVFPRIQLNGKPYMTLSYREKYEEPGVIVKNANNKNLQKVKIENNIQNEKIGNYYVDYSLKMGFRTLHVRRNVKIIDDIAPVIKLKGNQIMELSINKEYKEPGFNAYDEYDGDITEKVETIGKVDNEKYGEYIIKYKVYDNSNNMVEVNRIIKVIDEISPKIECETDMSIFKIGTEKPIGCRAIDNFDGDITDRIKILGNYDTNIIGTYEIEYDVEDNAGNKTTKEHKIRIVEK